MQDIEKAAKSIIDGGVVAFPTETVYGMGCLAGDITAEKRIYEIKNRPKNNPLQILVKSLQDAEKFGVFNDIARKLASKHWPGALTIVVAAKPGISSLDKVGIRVPDHKMVLAILEKVGRPIAATSVNLSGEKPLTSYDDVKKFFGDKVDFVVGGANPQIGISSTVVDCSGDEMKILRQGSLKIEL